MIESQKTSMASLEQDSAESLATMQADIEKALQDKQQAKTLKEESHLTDAGTNQSNLQDSRVLDEAETSRVIEMAWEDRTPFAAIEHSYGLKEADVITLMRQELKPSSFRMWRQRVTGRATKHQAKRTFEVGRAYCKTQYKPR